MIATSPQVVCRLGTAQDDLSLLPDACFYNHESVWVAEQDGVIVGAVVMWDSGHSRIHLDCLTVREGHPTAGPALILAVNRWCQLHNKRVMGYYTSSLELAYHAKRRGGLVSGFMVRVLYPVTERTGASHG